MPFKSKAQRRKFAELLVKGEISPETYEEWNRETGKAKLPEYAHPRKRARPKAKAKRARSATRQKSAARAKPARSKSKSKTGRKT